MKNEYAEMKLAAEIVKVVQTAGIAGAVATPIFWGIAPSNQGLLFESLLIVCVLLGLGSSISLAFLGARERAWNGAVVTIVWVLILMAASAPQVIR